MSKSTFHLGAQHKRHLRNGVALLRFLELLQVKKRLASPQKSKSKDPLETIAYQAPDRLIPVASTSKKKTRRNGKRQASVDPLIRAVEIGKRFLVRNAE